ncbi:hypothetical protein IJ913_00385 [bacterium]|nr:hypothetical protein [bacterium]
MFPQCHIHLTHKSSGQLLQFSSFSILPFQQFGLVTFLQFKLHCSFIPFCSQSSHSSHSSSFIYPFQQSLFGSIFLQSLSHKLSVPFLSDQWSHSSAISSIPFQHDHQHIPTSTGQFQQFSSSLTTQSQQFGSSGLYNVHDFVHLLSVQLSLP